MLLVLCSISVESKAEDKIKPTINFNEFIIALKDKIILLKEELETQKKAGMKLKEIKAEIKCVVKRDAEGKLTAWVIEAGGGYETQEIQTLTTTWEPVEPIIVHKSRPDVSMIPASKENVEKPPTGENIDSNYVFVDSNDTNILKENLQFLRTKILDLDNRLSALERDLKSKSLMEKREKFGLR